MERKRVLVVGNCGSDFRSISSLLFSCCAEAVRADTTNEALDALRKGQFDLLLANRQFQGNSQAGVSLIKEIRADPRWNGMPVMLVSNYPDAQQTAAAAGALRGFGKDDLSDPATRELLVKVLTR